MLIYKLRVRLIFWPLTIGVSDGRRRSRAEQKTANRWSKAENTKWNVPRVSQEGWRYLGSHCDQGSASWHLPEDHRPWRLRVRGGRWQAADTQALNYTTWCSQMTAVEAGIWEWASAFFRSPLGSGGLRQCLPVKVFSPTGYGPLFRPFQGWKSYWYRTVVLPWTDLWDRMERQSRNPFPRVKPNYRFHSPTYVLRGAFYILQ